MLEPLPEVSLPGPPFDRELKGGNTPLFSPVTLTSWTSHTTTSDPPPLRWKSNGKRGKSPNPSPFLELVPAFGNSPPREAPSDRAVSP